MRGATIRRWASNRGNTVIIVGLYLTVSISIVSASPNIESVNSTNSNSARLKSFDQLFEARREPRTYREEYAKAATSDAKAQNKGGAHVTSKVYKSLTICYRRKGKRK